MKRKIFEEKEKSKKIYTYKRFNTIGHINKRVFTIQNVFQSTRSCNNNMTSVKRWETKKKKKKRIVWKNIYFRCTNKYYRFLQRSLYYLVMTILKPIPPTFCLLPLLLFLVGIWKLVLSAQKCGAFSIQLFTVLIGMWELTSASRWST